MAKAQFMLKGTVLNQEQKPVPYAVVSINESLRTLQSNANGEFKLENLKEGKVVVTIKCTGYFSQADTITISQNTERNFFLIQDNTQLDEVIVNTTRVTGNSGMAFSNMSKEELAKNNFGKDAPILLDQLPSVVVNTDAGNGVGYTGLRIRGTDATRINVTINGVPVNDAESQGTFL
jgi:iron complex outermembrane recepter protein